MRKTHRAFAGAFWLGSTLALDGLALKSGHDVPVSPVVVAAGVFVAPLFSSGIMSPDMDHQWAPGPPRNHYDWRFHRGFTHRVWFATVLTMVCGLIPFMGLLHAGLSASVGTLAFAPVNGWWSHLFGDMIFGRIKFGVWSFRLGRFWHWNVGLGWTTNGLAEKGGALWRDPAAKVSVAASGVLVAGHLALLVSAYS